MTGSGAAPTLALVVITRNEESNIGRCLASVSGLAEEMVVVDSGSTDGTTAIALEAGARVFTQEFLGYGRQKQLALEKAGGDWLLFLDADEWLDDEARRGIGTALQSRPPEDVTGFRLRMRTFYLGGWVEHGAWLNERKLRLVRRGAARWKEDVVHESLELTSGRSRPIPGRILHCPYRDLGHQLQKIDRYTEIISVRDQNTPAPRVLFGMILEPPLVFLQRYFLQLGFLDGLRGFLGASLEAFYFFLRYAKIRQRRRDREDQEKTSREEPDAHGR